ncbi:hypothetical protein N431DRAFT_7078 [Stipitochalara longipes BDJ]|nr:hypothetical protein N431DRAFT_7078 [Stipitochalara longipes BDJ]
MAPQDQAILEAEYKQNPKPNKAARAEIVEKVTLNEKEVQIWFQNRRQINRRKSRPLLPHEIAAFGLGGMAALSSDPASSGVFSSSQSGGELESCSQQEIISSQGESGSHQDEVEILLPESTVERVDVAKNEEVKVFTDDRPVFLPPLLRRQASSAASINENSSLPTTESVIKSFSSTPGYLANRWNSVNSSFSSPASFQQPTFCTPQVSSATQPASCPERLESSTSSSRMRLSLSLDGKAELITGLSPPRPHATRPASSSGVVLQKRSGLQRSHSALPYTQSPPVTNVIPPFQPRLPTGRSKDARTWEFCCDPEAQDELTTQAENESHGSALAAISLIRSASNSALKQNANKRNAPSIKPDSGKHGKRPKLGRATSSLARLQNPAKISSKPQHQHSDYSKDGPIHSPSGDSDKENWIPDEHGGNPRRRPLPSSRADKQQSSRAILGDNFNVPTHAVDFPGGRHRNRKSVKGIPEVFEDKENGGPVPPEVEKFMRGEVSPSKKGDLDCIQGLLSLSQGNWR